MGIETKIIPALEDVAFGREPKSWDWCHPKAIGRDIQIRGTLACPSSNWSIMSAAVDLGYVVHGWKRPPLTWDFDVIGWLLRYFRESRNGLMMHREPGSRIYAAWIVLAVSTVRHLADTGPMVDGRLPDLADAAQAWLDAFWSIVALGAAPSGLPRYGSKQEGLVVTVNGGRSWARRKSKGEDPHHIDQNSLGYMLMALRMLEPPRHWKKTWEWRVFRQTTAFGGLTNSMPELVGRIGRHSFIGPMEILAWEDGTRATLYQEPKGCSSSTSALTCVAAGPGRRTSCLYSDNGERGKRNVTLSPGGWEVSYNTGACVAWVDRPHISRVRVHPKDEGLFRHVNGGSRREMDVHRGGSEILYHVAIDKHEGAKILYSKGGTTPPVPPVPDPDPTTPDSIIRRGSIETDWAERIRGENKADQNAAYHAACVAILLHATASTGDLSSLRGHAKQLWRLLR